MKKVKEWLRERQYEEMLFHFIPYFEKEKKCRITNYYFGPDMYHLFIDGVRLDKGIETVGYTICIEQIINWWFQEKLKKAIK